MQTMTQSASPHSPRAALNRIPVTLVTGFLGSGKTTLINAALRAPELARTVVIVNEFGEVGLDHSLFAASSDAVVVLENGCLCCTVRGDLLATLMDLHQSRQAGRIPDFDNVVIETSGLAEPGPVLQAFLSEPTLDGLYRVASVLTLVDAVNFEGTITQHDEAIRQVAFADRILITKLDLVTEKTAQVETRLRATLTRLAPAAKIERNDAGAPPRFDLLRAQGFDAADPKADPLPWLALVAHERAHAGHAHAHGHDHADHDHADHLKDRGIESFVLTRTEPMAREELQFLLAGISQNLGPGLLRVKGLVSIAGEPGRPAVVQGAQHILHTMTWLERWPDSDERTRIVFIAQGVTYDALQDIVGVLERMSARTYKTYEKARLAREAAAKAKT
jgi:G3E family GTPase